MASTDLEKQLVEALEKVGADHDIDIVDVEVVGSSKASIVRVRIDNIDPEAPGISLEDVAANNSWISEVLDLIDPFPGSYTLEVSSPGMARPLRKRSDFERFAGEQVSLNTLATEGRRCYTGKLVGLSGDDIVIDTDEGTCNIPFDQLKNCKIKPDFEAAAKAAKRSGK